MLATPRPEYAAEAMGGRGGAADFWVGDRPFPHWLAADLARIAREYLADRPGNPDRRDALRAAISRRLQRWGRSASFGWERVQPAALPSRAGLETILDAVRGKMLFASEVAAGQRHLPAGEIEAALAELVAAGEVQAVPAIEVLHFGRAICRRCGETQLGQIDCWYCGDSRCWFCPTCQSYGTATGCQTLYTGRVRPRPAASPYHPPVLEHAMTKAQEEAAESLLAFLRAGAGREFLIWAVCGAGKTEVVLAATAHAAAAGARILVATPRREIASEHAGRFERAFPGLPLAVHYGGRHEDGGDDPALTIATTHQCLRYHEAYDLVILDEVDAFPYYGNRLLYHAVQRACRPEGRLVYLTATPPRSLRDQAANGDLPYARLPARPHGFPLPVPELHRLRLDQPGPGWKISGELGGLLYSGRSAGRPGLIFVPTVEAAIGYGRALQEWGRSFGWRIDYVHASDPDRQAKREAFAAGQLDFLIATTLLERGLTLGALDVYVLHADREDLFDASCLEQMAGRAGRVASSPWGAVHFIGERISRTMQEARAAIVAANDEARRRGFLTGG